MSKQQLNLRFGVLVLFVLVAAMSRLLPFPPNFSPVGSMALFGAAYFARKHWAFLVPLAALWLSSLVLDNVFYAQFYDGFVWFSNAWVYIAFVLLTLFGMWALRKVTVTRVLGASVGAAVLFFLVSNFGVWLTSGMYPPTFEGLMTCYAAAIPFFGNTLAGNLVFSAVLFGSFEWVLSQKPEWRLERA